MEKSYEAPKLSVFGDQTYKSAPGVELGASAADTPTMSAAACMTACGEHAESRIDIEITAERATFTITPAVGQLPVQNVAVAPAAAPGAPVAPPAKV
jgi:hypothetical protein